MSSSVTMLLDVLGGVFNKLGRTVQISKNGVEELSYLKCEHDEEVDSSLFAHINYFVTECEYERVIVQATDTNNSILARYYSCTIPVD